MVTATTVAVAAPARVGSRVTRPDTTTFLTVFLFLTVAVPSDLRIAGMGGAGSPAALWSLGGAVLWALFRLQRSTPFPQRSGVPRAMIWGLLGVTLASWVAAMMRPLPPFESSQADLGIIRMAAFCGLILLAGDGLTDRDRLMTMLRRFAGFAAALALLGLVQFYSGRQFVDLITLPGLTSSQDFAATVARGEFTRAAGTAMSPLEYAYVLVLAFPVALTFALFDTTRGVVRRSLPAALIGAALLVSVSRSGLVGLVLVLLALFITWPRATRKRMLVVAGFALVALYVAVPGMVGTMRYLFTATDADPSAQSRAGGLDVVSQFLPSVPLLGRGFGTFLPLYRIFDDQYLGMVIEIGFLGLFAFVGLLVSSAVACHLAARRAVAVERATADDALAYPAGLVPQLGYALGASAVAAVALTALFDMFSFPMAVGALSLLLGLCAAYRRLAAPLARPAADAASARRLLVYSAGIEWTGVQGTDRHLVQRLAEHVDVLWVDPPVSILRTWRRTPEEGPRWGRTVTSVAPGVHRLCVVAPPFPSRPLIRALSGRRLRRAIRWTVRRSGREPWAFVTSRPEPVLDALPQAVRVYFATDDFVAGAELLGLPVRRLRWAERRQLRDADLLVAVTPQITERWAGTGLPTLVLPNGCDTASFADLGTVTPIEIGLPGPVAGMVGQLSARIDLSLLEAVVDTGASLLLVGPRDPSFEPGRLDALIARPTVHWTGPVPFDELPAHLARIDVGLTPYASTDFNRASFPLKTLEYLAAGRPVVSTALPAVDQLGTDLVRTADGPAAYAAAVREELAAVGTPEAAGVAAACRAVARRHDWGTRARTLLDAIEAFDREPDQVPDRQEARLRSASS